ncbi:MAG TPA: hypothetical protein VJ944_05040, partial [Thermoplasmataceae archaeon]|nr:hypothetical protein [Thermoplasmataceae archaeon]
LSSLTGSVRAKTKRRYDAYIKTDMFKHEMGIRLLISYIAKRAAVLDMAATPEISFWHSHFYRVIFRVEHGAAKADNTLEQIGTLNKHKLLSNTYEDADEGPVWKGKLSNPDTVKSMADEKLVHSSPKSESYLNYLENEDTSVLFLELSDIARNVRSNMPPMEAVAQHLADMGVKSHRTHYSFSGLKVEDSLMTAYDNISKLMTEKYR